MHHSTLSRREWHNLLVINENGKRFITKRGLRFAKTETHIAG
jgi:hypothetical protein